jgi:hypothetical protein
MSQLESSKHVCERCKHEATTKGNLIQHLQKKKTCISIHSKRTCEEIVAELTRRESKERKYACMHCEKLFSTPPGKCKHQKICPLRPELSQERRIQQLEDQLNQLKETIETSGVVELKEQITMKESIVAKLQQHNTNLITILKKVKDPENVDADILEALNEEIINSAPLYDTQGKKKKKITFSQRKSCWNEYIGKDIGTTKCLCCQRTEISQLDFECGHVVAEAKGGDNTIYNLRPICRSCNGSMGTENMREYAKSSFDVVIS